MARKGISVEARKALVAVRIENPICFDTLSYQQIGERATHGTPPIVAVTQVADGCSAVASSEHAEGGSNLDQLGGAGAAVELAARRAGGPGVRPRRS